MKKFHCTGCHDLYQEDHDEKPMPYYWMLNIKWDIRLDDDNLYFTPDDQEENRSVYRTKINSIGSDELSKRVANVALQTERFDCSNCGGENCVWIVDS